MDNNQKERIAVGKIAELANYSTPRLKPDIPVNDKGISFDGEIGIFTDETETKATLIGSIPVQVKGTEVDPFSGLTRTFSFEMDDYRNYYEKGGALIFVVELKGMESKIFYKQLLPKELKNILEIYGEKKKRKSKSIRLRALNDTPLYNVCIKLYEEMGKQTKQLVEYNPFTYKDFDSFQATSLTFDPASVDNGDIFEHDFTVYGIKDSLEVPLQFGQITALSIGVKETIIVDKIVYTFYSQMHQEKDKFQILIEDSLFFEICKKTGAFKYRFTKFGSLETQIKLVKFFIDFVQAHRVILIQFRQEFTNINFRKGNPLNELKNGLSLLLKLEEVFNRLDIPTNVLVSDKECEFDTVQREINFCVKLLYDFNLKGVNIKDNMLVDIKIGNKKLKLLYRESESEKFLNIFSEKAREIRVGIIVDEKEYVISPYLLFIKEEYLDEVVNINYGQIINSFNNKDPFLNDQVFSLTNNFCLSCIRSYDKYSNKEALDIAEAVYSMYRNNLNSDTSTIIQVNLMQVKVRKYGNIAESDQTLLLDMKLNESNNVEALFCISVLLGSKLEADILFNRFNGERKEEYKNYPIYTLYKQM